MVAPEEFTYTNPTEHVLAIDIIREKGWLNRYCLDSRDEKILYYCEVKPNAHLIFHRGNKESPIIAEADICIGTPGATDIQFTEPRAIVHVEHIHHVLYPCKTEFDYDGKRYHWIGHTELVEQSTGDVLAQFHPSWHIMDATEHRLGKLVIMPRGMSMIDLIMITALVVQERSDEGKLAIKMARRLSEAREKKETVEENLRTAIEEPGKTEVPEKA